MLTRVTNRLGSDHLDFYEPSRINQLRDEYGC